MAAKLEWTSLGLFLVVPAAAVALTAWQVAIDRSVLDDYFGSLSPVVVMTGAAVAGVVAIRYLEGSSDFAIVADLVFRFDEDTNVVMPDALHADVELWNRIIAR